MNDKCFCHLNGYKVKDAEARSQLAGDLPIGDIQVSSIKSNNLLKMEVEPGYTTTVNGVTFVVNNDYSISVSGTASANTFFRLAHDLVLSPASYFFSGGTAGSGSYIQLNTNTNYYANTGSGRKSFTFTEETTITYVEIRIASGWTGEYTFYPMLVKGRFTDKYTPYFELATKEDLENVVTGNIDLSGYVTTNIYSFEQTEQTNMLLEKINNIDTGYHVVNIPLGSPVTEIPFGEKSFDLSSECLKPLEDFINKAYVSGMNKPILKIVNSSYSAGNYPMPIEITYINSSTEITDGQPTFLFFGLTLQTQSMLWRSKLQINGTWATGNDQDYVYTVNSASITLYEQAESGGSTTSDRSGEYILDYGEVTEGDFPTTAFTNKNLASNTSFKEQLNAVINDIVNELEEGKSPEIILLSSYNGFVDRTHLRIRSYKSNSTSFIFLGSHVLSTSKMYRHSLYITLQGSAGNYTVNIANYSNDEITFQ